MQPGIQNVQRCVIWFLFCFVHCHVSAFPFLSRIKDCELQIDHSLFYGGAVESLVNTLYLTFYMLKLSTLRTDLDFTYLNLNFLSHTAVVLTEARFVLLTNNAREGFVGKKSDLRIQSYMPVVRREIQPLFMSKLEF